MKLLRAALASVALWAPFGSEAARFTVLTPAALDLASGERMPSDLADVRLDADGVSSAFGIRIDRPGTQLAMRAPLVIGARYAIEGRGGVTYRLIVHSVLGGRMGVEILAPGERPAPPRILDLRGRYHLQSFTIDGGRAATAYPDLELLPAGRYRLGGGLGRWQSDGWILSLEGYYRRWGPADVSADGKAITFRFLRGARLFQVTFGRMEDAAPEKVAALERPPG